MSRPILIFDMDGVLVDVSDSYRETIARTVEHFTGRPASRESIQECKNAGGFNDDWQLSHHLVRAAGVDAPFDEVKARFQDLFLGVNGHPGLILHERWIAQPGLLEGLGRQFRLALFTGRPKSEAQMTLDRFDAARTFDPIVGMYEVRNHKPAPDGILQIMAAHPDSKACYIGDTIDDARAARAAAVPFIGIAAPRNPLYGDLVALFQSQGAHAILPDINRLPEALARLPQGLAS
jgi:HAD superfamily phosphatase